ncbi:hypothetical protein C6T64_28580 [Burkholderia cenocepacia]|nr:hypothetical protein C6T64_28580 [Burkholderia cenocepacia]
MPVGSTSHRSVQVLGFGNIGCLTPIRRLIRFLFVRPALCLGLPPDPQSPGEPLPLANTSPCRVCRGLSPPSECALPGAPMKKGRPRAPFVHPDRSLAAVVSWSANCASADTRSGRRSRPSRAGS